MNKNFMDTPRKGNKAEHTEMLCVCFLFLRSHQGTGLHIFLHFNVFAAIFSFPVIGNIHSQVWRSDRDDGNENVKAAHGKAVISQNAYLS